MNGITIRYSLIKTILAYNLLHSTLLSDNATKLAQMRTAAATGHDQSSIKPGDGRSVRTSHDQGSIQPDRQGVYDSRSSSLTISNDSSSGHLHSCIAIILILGCALVWIDFHNSALTRAGGSLDEGCSGLIIIVV